jgi:hypothetical protein
MPRVCLNCAARVLFPPGVGPAQDMEDSGEVPGTGDLLTQDDPVDPCLPVADVANTQDDSYLGSWVAEVSIVHKGECVGLGWEWVVVGVLAMLDLLLRFVSCSCGRCRCSCDCCGEFSSL